MCQCGAIRSSTPTVNGLPGVTAVRVREQLGRDELATLICLRVAQARRREKPSASNAESHESAHGDMRIQ